MTAVYLNRIATAVPAHDVHDAFIRFADRQLRDKRGHALFRRMVSRGQIEHRWSSLQPAASEAEGAVDADGFYRFGRFPSTAERMRRYERAAPPLADEAVGRLFAAEESAGITHVVIVSCTGLAAPGLDFHLMQRLKLAPSVERTVIGFMGCYAAINGLKFARHVVRSQPGARVLLLCLELCTLHLQETDDLEQVLSFLIFGDGCAAALVSAEPRGLALDGFHAVLVPRTAEHITWNIGDSGFDMILSGRVPNEIADALKAGANDILPTRSLSETELWAVHPGGRSVLDAVEGALDLPAEALAASRDILRRYGNMSSATILFVLEAMMREAPAGRSGCAMAFGPGLVAETMLFSEAA